MISTTSMIMQILAILISVAFPVALILYFRRRGGLSWKAVAFGALVWFLFSQVLEKGLHLYMFQFNGTTAEWLKQPLFYALYGGLAAGIFEEVGRYVAFRYWLKDRRERLDGISFGIGHGGLEAILIALTLGVSNLVYMNLLNAGTFDTTLGSQVPAETVAQIKSSLLDSSPLLHLLGGFERIAALFLHIAFSLIVLLGVRSGRISYLFCAILLHAGVDIVAAYATAAKWNLYLLEAILFVFGAVAFWYIGRTKRLFH
ncbi:YhfC family glutamic-type intramembrane protease [Tumebacillus sp. DT12]|uniref:YhfC family glutamic-type intramembrane protease n=1 Tax=Tumebacillus lacus TaxID=2995335 RepID=A0ABT3WYL1_9BACL|nr:YhfC family glutamic-type intramembrane protease [Tumebacillus lacus]MCX7569291.1 YhfC family glutamic-type intramembrane protease [Tumebacillus lacus]